MASWKKVIVSGSNISQLNNDSAYLIDNAGIQALGAGIVSSSGQVSDLAGVNNNQITITAGNGISFASGDGVFTLNQGSDETIADIAVDLNELGTETTIAQDDFIAMVDATDNGSQKITFSNLEDEIFGNVSGDATIAAGGALTIQNNAVEADMLNNNIISGQGQMTGDVADTDELLVSDAGTVKRADFSVVRDAVFNDISGDATIAAGGALTIANDAIDLGMLNDGALSVTASGDVAGQAALSTDAVQIALTIQSNAVENSMMADDSVDSAEIVDGAIDNVHFSAGAKTAISGAFTTDSSSLASRITTLEGSDFVYDLQVSDGGSGNGAISDAETLTIQGTSNEVTVAYADGSSAFTIGLPDAVTVTNVTASLKGDVDGTAGNASDLHNQSITSGEASQIGNINSVTISNTQWGYLGGQDQSVATSDSPSFTNLTVTGDLTVEGTRTELQVANLNVEDPLILLNSGSSGGADVGIIFGGSGDSANQGHAIGWDDSAGNFIFAEDVSAGDTDWEGGGGAILSKIGEIQTTNGANPSTVSLQGVGAINVRTDDETIWIYS